MEDEGGLMGKYLEDGGLSIVGSLEPGEVGLVLVPCSYEFEKFW